MKILDLPDLNNPSQSEISEIVLFLKSGKIVALPTDTIYGLAAVISNEKAVKNIFKMKKRNQKPIPVLVDSIEMAKSVGHINAANESFLKSVWPGPVSAVLFKRSNISSVLTADRSTVMIRWPNNAFLEKVITETGQPITGTSANISGEDSYVDSRPLIDMFESKRLKPDLMVDAGNLNRKNAPSTIIDLTQANPRILRVGATDKETLDKILKMGLQ